MSRSLIALILLAWATPLAAVPTVEAPNPTVVAVSREMTAYGEWMGRLLAIVRPVQIEAGNLSGAWQEALRAGPREGRTRFEGFVDRVEQAIGRSDAGLRALDRPDFPTLGLAEDLRPDSIIRDMLRINQESRTMVRSFLPIMDAISANDRTATANAVQQMMRSIQILLQSQIVLARASLASTSREQAAWEAINIQLLFFQSLERSFNAWSTAMRGAVDETLARDYAELARQTLEHAQTGSTKNQAEIQRLEAEARRLASAGEGERAAVLRRVARLFGVSEAYFTLGRDLAAVLQEASAVAARRPFGVNALDQIITRLVPLRPRFDAIALEESAVMTRND